MQSVHGENVTGSAGGDSRQMRHCSLSIAAGRCRSASQRGEDPQQVPACRRSFKPSWRHTTSRVRLGVEVPISRSRGENLDLRHPR